MEIAPESNYMQNLMEFMEKKLASLVKPKPVDECTFWFLDAEFVRTYQRTSAGLPFFQELQRDHPGKLKQVRITYEDVVKGNHFDDSLAVSHRWMERLVPDRDGSQLQALQDFLKSPSGETIKRVWIDAQCMPQEIPEVCQRSKEELDQFKIMLGSVNMLYLGMRVLILLDSSYLSRFWTQFEAWLSMQVATAEGLKPSSGRVPKGKFRYHIKCIYNAAESEDQADSFKQILRTQWADKTPQQAQAFLKKPDVTVTNQSDKEGQLGKILELDDKVKQELDRITKKHERDVESKAEAAESSKAELREWEMVNKRPAPADLVLAVKHAEREEQAARAVKQTHDLAMKREVPPRTVEHLQATLKQRKRDVESKAKAAEISKARLRAWEMVNGPEPPNLDLKVAVEDAEREENVARAAKQEYLQEYQKAMEPELALILTAQQESSKWSLVKGSFISGVASQASKQLAQPVVKQENECKFWFLKADVVKNFPRLKWRKTDKMPHNGIELKHEALIAALIERRNSNRTIIEFSPDEWDKFEIQGLRTNHFVTDGETFYQPSAGLPFFQQLQKDHPDALEEKTITWPEVVTGKHVKEIMAVSHRWMTSFDPDPDGEQLQAIQDFLRDDPYGKQVKLLWIDAQCMPQDERKTEEKDDAKKPDTRSPEELKSFERMLHSVNMLYLGTRVLILFDLSYLSRFWPLFEAWLSMQLMTVDGLEPALNRVRENDSRWYRHHVRSIYAAKDRNSDWTKGLRNMYYDKEPQQVKDMLKAKDVTVTNESDKEKQLPKIMMLNSKVQEAWQIALKDAEGRDAQKEQESAKEAFERSKQEEDDKQATIDSLIRDKVAVENENEQIKRDKVAVENENERIKREKNELTMELKMREETVQNHLNQIKELKDENSVLMTRQGVRLPGPGKFPAPRVRPAHPPRKPTSSTPYAARRESKEFDTGEPSVDSPPPTLRRGRLSLALPSITHSSKNLGSTRSVRAAEPNLHLRTVAEPNVPPRTLEHLNRDETKALLHWLAEPNNKELTDGIKDLQHKDVEMLCKDISNGAGLIDILRGAQNGLSKECSDALQKEIDRLQMPGLFWTKLTGEGAPGTKVVNEKLKLKLDEKARLQHLELKKKARSMHGRRRTITLEVNEYDKLKDDFVDQDGNKIDLSFETAVFIETGKFYFGLVGVPEEMLILAPTEERDLKSIIEKIARADPIGNFSKTREGEKRIEHLRSRLVKWQASGRPPPFRRTINYVRGLLPVHSCHSLVLNRILEEEKLMAREKQERRAREKQEKEEEKLMAREKQERRAREKQEKDRKEDRKDQRLWEGVEGEKGVFEELNNAWDIPVPAVDNDSLKNICAEICPPQNLRKKTRSLMLNLAEVYVLGKLFGGISRVNRIREKTIMDILSKSRRDENGNEIQGASAKHFERIRKVAATKGGLADMLFKKRDIAFGTRYWVDEALGHSRHNFAVLGPNVDYGPISLVLQASVMQVETVAKASLVVNAAACFCSGTAYELRPWAVTDEIAQVAPMGRNLLYFKQGFTHEGKAGTEAWRQEIEIARKEVEEHKLRANEEGALELLADEIDAQARYAFTGKAIDFDFERHLIQSGFSNDETLAFRTRCAENKLKGRIASSIDEYLKDIGYLEDGAVKESHGQEFYENVDSHGRIECLLPAEVALEEVLLVIVAQDEARLSAETMDKLLSALPVAIVQGTKESLELQRKIFRERRIWLVEQDYERRCRPQALVSQRKATTARKDALLKQETRSCSASDITKATQKPDSSKPRLASFRRAKTFSMKSVSGASFFVEALKRSRQDLVTSTAPALQSKAPAGAAPSVQTSKDKAIDDGAGALGSSVHNEPAMSKRTAVKEEPDGQDSSVLTDASLMA